MKFQLICLVLFISGSVGYSQVSDTEMQSLKSKWRVELQSKGHELALKAPKVTGSAFADSVQCLFLEDTFVVENLLRKELKKDPSTLGMNKANLASASEYEKLVDSYFVLLSSKMKKEDVELLISWQKDWKIMLEKERALIGKLMQEEYSGGGSLQSLEYSNRLRMQQKNRLLLLVDYLTHLI
jgi:hypothetical protein